MNKNDNITNLDHYQMDNRSFDGSKDAYRVSVVDGITLNVDQINIPKDAFQMKQEKQEVLKIPEIIREYQVIKVDVPVVIKEVEKVEIPVVVPEVRIIEIEKPVLIKEVEIKVIEKEVQRTSNFEKVCMVVQIIMLFGLILTKLI